MLPGLVDMPRVTQFSGPLPVVDPARCTADGACVAACPTGCLELRGPLPWVARPADCLSCGACAAVCPADAIRFPAPDPVPPA